MNLRSTRCQKVRDGAIIIIITIIIIVTNALILAIVTILATGPNRTNLKTADKVNLRGQKGKDSKITLTQGSAHFIPIEVQQQFLQTV